MAATFSILSSIKRVNTSFVVPLWTMNLVLLLRALASLYKGKSRCQSLLGISLAVPPFSSSLPSLTPSSFS